MRHVIIKRLQRSKGFITGAVLTSSVFLFVSAATTSDSYFEVAKNLDIFATVCKELNSYYVDPIEPGNLIKTGIDAMLDNLDPYTNYITESDIEEYEFQTTGKYGGIGATMRKKGEDIYVGDVYENSPAQKAGLHPGDLIISIDEHLLKSKTIDDISVLLKGAPGTQVSLKVKDAYNGAVSQKMITRGEIELSSVPYASLAGAGNNIAYVKLTQFTETCSRQVKDALDSLKKTQPKLAGVILDLRGNPGGLLNEAVSVCNLFLDKGALVVTTKGKAAEMDKEYKTPDMPWDMQLPVVVMVNRSSASASEIVAGTLQDLDRGVVLGERSYGKGLVQNVRPLGYNARLKITTAKYYTPSGRCIQAIDYSHRNADGSVAFVPDSLQKSFKTKNGRLVKSGGGIEPDMVIKQEPVSRLLIALYTKSLLFDYSTQYAQTHKTIPAAADYSLSDNEYTQFVKWLESKDFSYRAETDDVIDSLKQTAMREKYYDDAKAELTALQATIARDKKQDLMKSKDEIERALENEIVSRYYFQRGRIAQGLRGDKQYAKAVEILEQPAAYKGYLKLN